MKTILAPLDFSYAGGPVLRQARALARASKARLVLLHVVRIPIMGEYPGVIMETTEILDAMQRSCLARIGRMALKLRKSGIPATGIIRVGSPGYEIVEEARKSAASQIVIGAHGHGALETLFVGSATAFVLRHAHCPVVVVPVARPKAGAKR